jgi:gas vesicle protein
MSSRDDVPYIIVERDSGSGIGSFVLGALLGAGAALLLAPRSGRETQDEIRERARQLRESAEERLKEASSHLEARLEDARDGVEARLDRVRDAVDSGKQAAGDARVELEDKLERSKAAYRAGIEAARAAATAPDADEPDTAESD